MASSIVPAHWTTLANVLRRNPHYSVSIWFNPHYSVSIWFNLNASPSSGYTAQILNGRGGFAPHPDEGAIWSAFAETPVKAVDDLARLVHRTVA